MVFIVRACNLSLNDLFSGSLISYIVITIESINSKARMSQIPLFEKKVDPEKPKEKSLPSNVGAWQKVWSDEFSECM